MAKRIISVSYKDDTPAFKSEQFFRDLEKGYRDLPTKIGTMRVSLLPKDVYCFVFWTKNPSDHFINNMMNIRSPFYIQWTITGYDNDIETNMAPKEEIISRFQKVSNLLGPERTIWRYDPILMNAKYTVEEHIRRYTEMAQKMKGYTRTCVISFMDEYGKISQNVKAGEMRAPRLDEIHAMSKAFAEMARKNGLKIQTCSEGTYDLTEYGIHEKACIDSKLIEELSGEKLPEAIKKPNSFRRCSCAVNTDIGSYHTCKHGCKYCYAK